jgi:hypothetical protein
MKLWVDKISDEPQYNCNEDVPIISQFLPEPEEEKWFYCAPFYKRIIKDVLTNVLYASARIKNPFDKNETSTEAHMWWRVRTENKYLILFETANATNNKEIVLGQHSAIACVEKTGGKVEVEWRKEKDMGIAYTRIWLPLFSYFLTGEKNEI